MCKYEMDRACILEDTERTRYCPQIIANSMGFEQHASQLHN